jgi:carbon-monoxide dehydrogenase small subunit
MDFTLNGEPVTADLGEGQSLLELLRDDFGLRSIKDGCAPEGSCGACTVIVDGHAVVSCAQKAQRIEGKHVVTQEGLRRRAALAQSSSPRRVCVASARRAS